MEWSVIHFRRWRLHSLKIGAVLESHEHSRGVQQALNTARAESKSGQPGHSVLTVLNQVSKCMSGWHVDSRRHAPCPTCDTCTADGLMPVHLAAQRLTITWPICHCSNRTAKLRNWVIWVVGSIQFFVLRRGRVASLMPTCSTQPMPVSRRRHATSNHLYATIPHITSARRGECRARAAPPCGGGQPRCSATQQSNGQSPPLVEVASRTSQSIVLL